MVRSSCSTHLILFSSVGSVLFLLLFPAASASTKFKNQHHSDQFTAESASSHNFHQENWTSLFFHQKIIDQLYFPSSADAFQRIPKCHILLVNTNSSSSSFATMGPFSKDFMHIVPALPSTSKATPTAPSTASSGPTLQSFMSIFYTIVQHANDRTSSLFHLLNVPVSTRDTADSVSKGSTAFSAETAIDPSDLLTTASFNTLNSDSSNAQENISKQRSMIPIPEYMLFGTVSSATTPANRYSSPPLTPSSFARLLQHFDTTTSLSPSSTGADDCDVIPFPSLSKDWTPVSLQASLRQTLGQYGIKAWMSLLKSLGSDTLRMDTNQASKGQEEGRASENNKQVDKDNFNIVLSAFNLTDGQSPQQRKLSATTHSNSIDAHMNQITSKVMLQSLRIPVFAHAHFPSHPFHLAKFQQQLQEDTSSTEPPMEKTDMVLTQAQLRHLQNFAHLYPILSNNGINKNHKDNGGVEPYLLLVVRPLYLLPLAHFMIAAHEKLYKDNQWNLEAMFYGSETMALQIFERLPAFFLHLVIKDINVCKPFRATKEFNNAARNQTNHS